MKAFRWGAYILFYIALLAPLLFFLSDTICIDDRDAMIISTVTLVLYVTCIFFCKRKKHYNRNTRKKHMPCYSYIKIAVPILFLICVIYASYHYFHSQQDVAVPDNILEFVDKYPEAQPFADDYQKYYNKKIAINIEEDLDGSEIPLFIQWDRRWGYQNYGSSLIGISGCGPTCLSMVLCGLTNDTKYSPLYIADFSSQQGYYVPGQGTSWDLFTNGAKTFGLNVKQGNINESYILNNLSESSPMICSMKPGDFTYTGHFIVLVGIDSEGKAIINDPNSPQNSSKHWELSVITPQIKSLWSYSL